MIVRQNMPSGTKLTDKIKKIMDYAIKNNDHIKNPTRSASPATESYTSGRKSQKRVLSPITCTDSKKAKINQLANMDSETTTNTPSTPTKEPSIDGLQHALGPLLQEFKTLRESVKSDYEDLKHTITKQKVELQQELVNKIDMNSQQLSNISHENRLLRKENNALKVRLDKIEQDQLRNNVLLTGIPEGPFEDYNITKLRVQEMLAITINSGDATKDLETAKQADITNCRRLGKYRPNYSRPISVTFSKRDDKELLLSNKRSLPDGIFANEEFPLHIKRNRDKLRPILRLAKTLPNYREKSKLVADKLIINGVIYGVDNIHSLPPELAAYKVAEKSNDTHIVFAGELSPYSNFHKSPFTINGQLFHCSEQWIQYQKALAFGDSYTANQILQTDNALDCK